MKSAHKIISKGKKFLLSPQSSVFSAAGVIMLMVIASRALGLVRQRALAHFFATDELSLFFAAFRLPDLLFEVLVFGTFSSAFIPVFTKTLKKGRKQAWQIASSVTNIGLVAFIILSPVILLFAEELYKILVPGFSPSDILQIANLTRLLLIAQAFFIVSYVLTGVLESSKRFLIPALAPLFYNLGIIAGTVLLSKSLGIYAPVVGVIAGAALHFLVQLPLALKLGYKFSYKIKISRDVRKIGKLAFPRIIEVSFLQIARTVELSLASLISVGSYAFFTFGNSIQLLPVGLFGSSVAKAALPTLSRQADNISEFRRTLFNSLNQVIFVVAFVSAALLILRIPVVRLVFGTDLFSWEATIQTSMVVSAFSFGIIFQAANALLTRGFYALHDTKTPVVISVLSIVLNILAAFISITVLGLPAWGLAASFSLSVFIQASLLFFFMARKIGDGLGIKMLIPSFKSILAAFVSGVFMYFFLKLFDRSVWVKRLSFLGQLESTKYIPFERFVLDTRYTANLLILTLLVVFAGGLIYLGISSLLGSNELSYFVNLAKRIIGAKKLEGLEVKEESLVPPPSDTQG